jgi:hypothetical protein
MHVDFEVDFGLVTTIVAWIGGGYAAFDGIAKVAGWWRDKNKPQQKIRDDLSEILVKIQERVEAPHFPFPPLFPPTTAVLREAFLALKSMRNRGLKSPNKQHMMFLLELVGGAWNEWEWIEHELRQILDEDDDQDHAKKNEIGTQQAVLLRTVDENVKRYIAALGRIEYEQVFILTYLRYRCCKPVLTVVDRTGKVTEQSWEPATVRTQRQMQQLADQAEERNRPADPDLRS